MHQVQGAKFLSSVHDVGRPSDGELVPNMQQLRITCRKKKLLQPPKTEFEEKRARVHITNPN